MILQFSSCAGGWGENRYSYSSTSACTCTFLVQENLETRRKHLYSSLKTAEGECQFAKTMESSEVEEISQFLNDAIAAGTEGLIVKSLSGDGSTYEPAKRSQNWIKLKKDYMDGVGDSIDAVVIGAYYGKGKRVGLYGAFLLAVYNDGMVLLALWGEGFSVLIMYNSTRVLTLTVLNKQEMTTYMRASAKSGPVLARKSCPSSMESFHHWN